MKKVSGEEEIKALPVGTVVMTGIFTTYLKDSDNNWVERRSKELTDQGQTGWNYSAPLTDAKLAGFSHTVYVVYGSGGWQTDEHEEKAEISQEEARERCGHEYDGDCFDEEHIHPDGAYEYRGHSENNECFDSDHIHPDDADDYCSHDDDYECSHYFSMWPTQVKDVVAVHLDGRYVCDKDQIPEFALDKLKEILS